MTLEFFADTPEGVLLLYSGSPSEVEWLRGHVRQLTAPGRSIRVHALEFVRSLNSCELTFLCAEHGHGVHVESGTPRFTLQLGPSDWERVSDLLEPFCHPEPDVEGTRFQYLHDYDGIEVIYSTARQW
jgi:hypothetical protein